MKTPTLVLSLFSSSLLHAMPPTAGTMTPDVTFSIAENYSNETRVFGSLNDSMLSSRAGKVTLLAYATPW